MHLLLAKERPNEKLGWTISSQTIANHNPKQPGALSSFALFLMGEGYIFRKKHDNADKDYYGNTKWKLSTETQRSGVRELLDTLLDLPRMLSPLLFSFLGNLGT